MGVGPWRFWLVLCCVVAPLEAKQLRRKPRGPSATQAPPQQQSLVAHSAGLTSRRGDAVDGHKQEPLWGERTCPPMFVAVFSAQDHVQQREDVRGMWSEADEHWGELQAKFVLCDSPKPSSEIKAEARKKGDILFLDCQEGYRQGRLTAKLLTTMRKYVSKYDFYDLFMKVDDDTWVSPKRLCGRFLWREDNHFRNTQLYSGVFAEGLNESLLTNHTPNRDPSSNFYEPYETFPEEIYPLSAKGGPGYILARNLVQSIVHSDIPTKHLLNNEDKAVGVWIDQLRRRKVEVDIVNIPGTDGYAMHADQMVKNGTYSSYPYFVHHHLPGPTVACLHRLDRAGNASAPVDACFKNLRPEAPHNATALASGAASAASATWPFGQSSSLLKILRRLLAKV